MEEKDTNALVERLKRAAGENLQSVVLYGSAASGEFRPKHSDLNILCLLRRVDPAELRKLHDPARWWAKKGHPAPLVFTLEELKRAADVYAIELLEIKSRRRILYGEDVFASFETSMSQYRMQVERELRHNLVRLRQGYIAVARNHKAVVALMARSSSTFALLFRHALNALGEEPPPSKREAVERLAALLGLSATSFRDLFKVRAGTLKAGALDAELIFRDYLEAVTRAVDEISRRLDTHG
ncbi:MAG: nucleotidyltransferase domain-containing protein [Terriglobia bacterium]